MRNPFKKSSNKTPEGEPLERIESGYSAWTNKLVIITALITFLVIILVLTESVVIVQAGHRGVILYLGAVENRVLGEGGTFYYSVCGTSSTTRSSYIEISS